MTLRFISALRRMRNQLAFRLLLISALAVAAIVPVRLLEARQMREHSVQDGIAAVSQIADGGIARLREIVDESKTIMTVAALLPAFANAEAPECHALLTPIVAETGWINSLSMVTAGGIVTCSSNSNVEGLQIGDRPYFQDALAQHTFQLSGLTLSRSLHTPVLLAALPVRFPQSTTAVLVMSINASWFSAVAEQVAHSAPGGIAMILDGEGNVLGQSASHANDADLGAEAIRSGTRQLEHEGASTVTFPDGRTLMVSVREIPHSSSLLIIGVPQAELDRHALAAERNLFEDVAIAIALVVLVFWLGHESLVRPAQALAGAARRLGQGAFDIEIKSAGWASEFQVLAGAITQAAANLANRAKAEAQINASLRAQSHEDPLTGLKNRRGLDDFVEGAWATCAGKNLPFAAIAFDIDFFKAFNDRYGHDAGDEALRAIARVMQDQATEAGGVAARTGGEEFTVVVPGYADAAAHALAQAVALRLTALHIPHAGSPLGLVTTSAGIACAYTAETLMPSDIFRAADKALYGAKDAGRNAVTLAAYVTPARPVRPAGDDGDRRQESSRDKPGRAPSASPSAMSR